MPIYPPKELTFFKHLPEGGGRIGRHANTVHT